MFPTGHFAEQKFILTKWRAPSTEMARRALSGHTLSGQLMSQLLETWEKMHCLTEHNDISPITSKSEKVRLCYLAGFCLCGRQKMKLRTFASSCQKLLGEALAKGTPI